MDANPKQVKSYATTVQTRSRNNSNVRNLGQGGKTNTASANKFAKQQTVSLATKSLQTHQRLPAEDDIEVTFEVLLSDEMTFPTSKVQIVFGPPLSNWDSPLVEMRLKEGTPIPETLTPLIGVLYLPRQFQSKNIPYKYVVKKSYDFAAWEFIKLDDNEGQRVNRCLLVPSSIQKSFTKFDDVILAQKRLPGCHDSNEYLQRLGREAATNLMLPRPYQIDNPDFDFSAALERFSLVVQTHGWNGTSLCLGDHPKRKFNPVGYDIDKLVEGYLDNFTAMFEKYLEQDDSAKLLRATLCLLLLSDQRKKKLTFQFCLKIFEAFSACQDVLFNTKEQVHVTFFCNESSKI